LFYDQLNTMLKEAGVTSPELSDILEKRYGQKVSKESIGKYRLGKRDPNTDFIRNVADFLRVDPGVLFGVEKHPVRKVPIIGSASCGGSQPDQMQDGGFCYYNGEYFTDKLYCVIAYGDSMAPEIDDGDEVVCDPAITLQNGDMAHYTLNGEDAIKVFVKDEDANIIQLVPYNPSEEFVTKTIRLDDDLTIQSLVMSKVVTVNKRKFNNRSARLKLIGRG